MGERVQSLRHKRRFTLEGLALKAHLSKGFLSEIEHGLALPSLTTLARLAGQLELPLHELVRLGPVPAKAAARSSGASKPSKSLKGRKHAKR